MPAKLKHLVFPASLIIFLYFILEGITLPYVGPNATNFNVYSLIAHNFNKFGYLETKLAPVISVAETLPDKPEYFFHHPTLLSFMESLLFKIFGETFWAGRLTVILFALGLFILTFLIAKILKGEKYAKIAVFVGAIIPASTIFGKLIGQEPLVLFFGLLTLYAVLKYLSSTNKLHLITASLSIILGIFSDWPMAFFIFCFLPLFIQRKKLKLGLYLAALSVITTTTLLIYIYFMRSGFWDLQNALALRSFNGLLSISFWPIRWIAATILRIFVYFNPVLFTLSILSLYEIYRKQKGKKLSTIHLVLFGLFLFGAIHLMIYAQAAFTHPYLIYYSMPFVTLGSSLLLTKFLAKKQHLYPILIISFSLLYLLLIQFYKSQQIKSNLWRYDLTLAANKYLSNYEEVVMNRSSVIDADSLWYPFLKNRFIADPDTPVEKIEKYQHYLYSCLEKCNVSDAHLAIMMQRYNYILITNQKAEVYIFLLQQKRKNKENNQQPIKKIQLNRATINNEQDSMIRKIYRNLNETLQIPQF